MAIEKRPLGKTGVEVTMLGLGGEGILRTTGYEDEAYALINRAIDLGINYCESARAYADSESYYGRALRERRGDVFLTSKSHARDSIGALSHLRETLKNMKTDHLDLWQVHDVRTEEDVAEIFGEGGAIEAFVEAKRKGMTRFIGITGHHDPAIMRKCLELFDFDTVLLPMNPGEPSYRSFLQEVVPLALAKRMGIIGMKVYFRGLAERLPWFTSMEPFLRFALTQPVTTVVIGCDNIDQLDENVKLTESFTPMTDLEMQALVHKVSAYARKLMYYKP
jgi:aryl-alcohol dehydrogenase-like predicted oxidoreductase